MCKEAASAKNFRPARNHHLWKRYGNQRVSREIDEALKKKTKIFRAKGQLEDTKRSKTTA